MEGWYFWVRDQMGKGRFVSWGWRVDILVEKIILFEISWTCSVHPRYTPFHALLLLRRAWIR